MNGGRASNCAWLGRGTATEFSGNDYAVGGARDARCSEKESSGEAFSGRTACQATCRASGIKSRGAAANAGICSDWQTWQAVSGPPVCWWTKAPPAAKYKSATQPNMANARLPEMNLNQSICLLNTPQCSSLDGQTVISVAIAAFAFKRFVQL